MITFWRWIIAFAVVWPIQFSIAAIGEKGIDLVFSDLVILLLPMAYFAMGTLPQRLPQGSPVRLNLGVLAMAALPAALFIGYSIAIAAIGVGMSGETIRLLSAFKLVKPIGFLLLGMMFCTRINSLEFINTVAWAFSIVVGLAMLQTVIDPAFPFGAWGKYIFGYELYGYPNAPMSFFAALVPLLLAAADTARFKWSSIAARVLVVFAALLIVGSMSRSSTIALAVGILIYLVLTGRTPFLVASGVAGTILTIMGYGVVTALKDTEIFDVLSKRIEARVAKTTGEDPSSGRFDIWEHAIELWTEKPIFGYFFESFSHYSEYDTPHQQYLEVLYKCGGLGLVIYLWLLLSCFWGVRYLMSLCRVGSKPWYCLRGVVAMYGAVLIGNLTQPNLTYSLTGNLVFLVFGCLLTRTGALAVVQGSAVPTPAPAKLSARPLGRRAAA